MTRFVVIASGKGGVGKTFVSLNLATALSQFGRDVILVDANLSTPHIGMHLGSTTFPVTIHDVLQGKKHIHQALYQHPSKITVVPGSVSLNSVSSKTSPS